MDNILDHLYTTTTYDKHNPVEFTYKLSAKEIEDLVKLRVSNQHLFSGRRNAAKYAWRAILKHMGLQGVMTHSQASKKWDNLKKKYKDLKFPLEGVKAWPDQWPYFTLMSDALEGRLAGSAPVLAAPGAGDHHFLPASRPRKRPALRAGGGSEIEVLISREEEEEEEEGGGSREMHQEVDEVDSERALLDRERVTLERDREVLERERRVLERERAGMEREMAALYRDQASLERERAAMERERAVLERERGGVEKDMAMLSRDRRTLKREREELERRKEEHQRTAAGTGREPESSPDPHPNPEALERRERFLSLFHKLIETL